MKWLITGGCGFIGSSLIDSLVRSGGHEIRVIDNLTVGSEEILRAVCNYKNIKKSQRASSPVGVELLVGDLLDADLVAWAAEGVDYVVHLAASAGVAESVSDPVKDCLNNVVGTLNALEAARKAEVKRFIFASSGAPVGECIPPIHEELPAHPVSPYGASKLSGEGYCSAFYRSYGLETVALRFGNVYGPRSGHKTSVVAKFIRQAMQGETLEIYGDGQQTRDYIYITDLINAIMAAVSSDSIGGNIFQIATNKETSLNELVDLILPIMATAGHADVEVVKTKPRTGDVLRNFSDTSKAKKRLNWESHVSLEEGIKNTVEWFFSKEAVLRNVSTNS